MVSRGCLCGVCDIPHSQSLFIVSILHILYKVFVVTVYDYQQKPYTLFCRFRAVTLLTEHCKNRLLVCCPEEQLVSLLAYSTP